MKLAILITSVLLLLIYVVNQIGIVKALPTNIVSYDQGQYELLLGRDAKQVFLYYRVTSMHGLSLDECEERISIGDSYIDGLSNYNPRDKNFEKNPQPFLFLNISSLQNNYSMHEVHTCIMHECMHTAGIIYDGCWDSHEEQMITWAEDEANAIIVLLKKNKYI